MWFLKYTTRVTLYSASVRYGIMSIAHINKTTDISTYNNSIY